MKNKPYTKVLRDLIKNIEYNYDQYIDLTHTIEDSIHDSVCKDEDYDMITKLGKKGFDTLIKNCINKKSRLPRSFGYIYDELKREAEYNAAYRKRQEEQRLAREFANAQKIQAKQDVKNKRAKFLASLTKEQKALYKETHKGE